MAFCFIIPCLNFHIQSHFITTCQSKYLFLTIYFAPKPTTGLDVDASTWLGNKSLNLIVFLNC